jgi:hypothetical protein
LNPTASQRLRHRRRRRSAISKQFAVCPGLNVETRRYYHANHYGRRG